jgi:opacity protein-like surface antigen
MIVMRPLIAASVLVAALAPSVSAAQGTWGLDANIGTLGYGAGVGLALNESLTVRLYGAGATYKRNFESSGVDYNARLQWRNAPVLLDWHPGGSVFRISAGIMLNDDKVTVDAKPSSTASYEFNGRRYTAADVGSANGTIKFNRAAPYIGFGFGRPIARHQGLSFGVDFGAAYLGKAKASLDVTCGSALPAAQCTQLKNDANAEAAQLADDIKGYKWWPVVQMHLTYAF